MYRILIQRAARNACVPASRELRLWAKQTLEENIPSAELTIRIVNEDEMITLNNTYRNKNQTTNVLSFPFDMPAENDLDLPLLGDIVICADVVEHEARAQNKMLNAHWAHMVVHGTLHLLGFDHEKNSDAEVMEAREILILKKLGFSNPY